MNTLKSLTFTTVPKIGANPTLDRRAKVIERLEEQKLLLADPAYRRTIRTLVKKDGERIAVENQQRVLPGLIGMSVACAMLTLPASPANAQQGQFQFQEATIGSVHAALAPSLALMPNFLMGGRHFAESALTRGAATQAARGVQIHELVRRDPADTASQVM